MLSDAEGPLFPRQDEDFDCVRDDFGWPLAGVQDRSESPEVDCLDFKRSPFLEETPRLDSARTLMRSLLVFLGCQEPPLLSGLIRLRWECVSAATIPA
jgi:hypothetical protein